jgi:hypothetical protein
VIYYSKIILGGASMIFQEYDREIKKLYLKRQIALYNIVHYYATHRFDSENYTDEVLNLTLALHNIDQDIFKLTAEAYSELWYDPHIQELDESLFHLENTPKRKFSGFEF